MHKQRLHLASTDIGHGPLSWRPWTNAQGSTAYQLWLTAAANTVCCVEDSALPWSLQAQFSGYRSRLDWQVASSEGSPVDAPRLWTSCSALSSCRTFPPFAVAGRCISVLVSAVQSITRDPPLHFQRTTRFEESSSGACSPKGSLWPIPVPISREPKFEESSPGDRPSDSVVQPFSCLDLHHLQVSIPHRPTSGPSVLSAPDLACCTVELQLWQRSYSGSQKISLCVLKHLAPRSQDPSDIVSWCGLNGEKEACGEECGQGEGEELSAHSAANLIDYLF